MTTCGWTNKLGYEADEEEPLKQCTNEATHLSCSPIVDLPVCEEHKCRCNRLLSGAAWIAWAQKPVTTATDGKMRILVEKRDGAFVVTPTELPGSPRVGRGRTMLEAMGDFLIGYQERFKLDITVHPSAQRAEQRRRQARKR